MAITFGSLSFRLGTSLGSIVVPPVDTTAPTITSASAISAPEGAAYSLPLTANETVTWSKVGGADAGLFTLTGSTLSLPAKTFATPGDADGNNTYVVQVRAADAGGNTTDQAITFTVTSVNENIPAAMRGGGYGASAYNVRGTDGAAQWSFLSRDPYSTPVAFNSIEVAIPLWTLERAGSSTVLETDLPEAYDFEVALEYPFADSSTSSPNLANRTQLLVGGQVTYSYVPGTTDKKAIFSADLPFTIPANALFGLIIMHECVAGRSGGVTNKRIQRSGGSSTFIGRKNGGVSSTSALKGSTMTRTAFTAASSSQVGTTASLLAGAIRVMSPAGVPSILVDGNSIEEGANEGTSFSGNYGDAGGDMLGNKGWATRLAQKLGRAVTNLSRGGDRDSYRLSAGNYARRMDFAAWLNPTHFIDLNPHNDVPAVSSGWAASTAYALDSTVRSNGNGYICTQAGTSAASGGITGTGANITDGTAKWTYIGPDDMGTGSQLGIAWVGIRRKRLRLVQAALPDAKLIAPTCTPDGLSNRTASAYSYDSGTGALTITVANASDLVVGGRVRISGLTPSGLNTAGVSSTPITAISGNIVTVTRATGLAAPTGTLVLNTTWSSVSGQQPATNYTAGNSFRSWVNRFLRNQPNPVLPYAGILDIGKAMESSGAVTPAAETGAWKALLEGGLSLGSAATSDGTHPTSWGNDDIATTLAADPTVVALLAA